jgi:hypothetical protein
MQPQLDSAMECPATAIAVVADRHYIAETDDAGDRDAASTELIGDRLRAGERAAS